MALNRYVYADDLSPDERKVHRSGYPFVNTIVLGPYATLQPHAHNSKNTHFIVEGQMTMWYTGSLEPTGTYKKGQSVAVPPRVCYRGEAGPDGCIFVEGHTSLSPTSAERFEALGTIVRVEEGNMRDNGRPQVRCTTGRCHWSFDRYIHLCAEFGEGPSTNLVCNVREQMMKDRRANGTHNNKRR